MGTILGWSLPLVDVGGSPYDVSVVAMTHDGELLLSTVSSRDGASTCLDTDGPRMRFSRRFPEGYTLTWIDNPTSDERAVAAVEAYKKLGADGDRRL
jgi:hypothetical protein